MDLILAFVVFMYSHHNVEVNKNEARRKESRKNIERISDNNKNDKSESSCVYMGQFDKYVIGGNRCIILFVCTVKVFLFIFRPANESL